MMQGTPGKVTLSPWLARIVSLTEDEVTAAPPEEPEEPPPVLKMELLDAMPAPIAQEHSLPPAPRLAPTPPLPAEAPPILKLEAETVHAGPALLELDQLDEESEPFPETPAEPGAFNDAAIDQILADFQSWLQEAKEVPEEAAAPSFDLATVVQQFTALRQDVNLQTKASRSVLEQNTQALDALRQAIDTAEEQRSELREHERQRQDELIRPLLKTLVDAHDALSLACREVERQLVQLPTAAPVVMPTLPQAASTPPPVPPLEGQPLPAVPASPAPPPALDFRLPLLARFFGGGRALQRQLAPFEAWQTNMAAWHQEARAWHEASPAWQQAMQAWHAASQAWYKQACAWQMALANIEMPAPPEDLSPRYRGMLDALLAGYQMSRERLERAMRGQGLEPMARAGEPFDPETMEVVEVVREEGRIQTEVIEVVRSGYRWNDRLFRYAQVRVAKP